MISFDKKETVKKWFGEYFTKGNLESLDEITTEYFVFHSRNGDNTKDRMKEFMDWYRSVFHEDEWEINDLIEQGQKLVVR